MEMNEQQFDIKYYVRVVYRRRKLAILAAMCLMTTGIVASFFVPKVYEATSTVLIQRDIINDLIKDITATPPVQERVKALSVVLTSRTHLLKVMSDLDMVVDRMSEKQIESTIKSMQARTKVKIEASSAGRNNEKDLFTVSYTHDDPRMARDFVNALIRRYIEANLYSSREAVYGANRFIFEQLDMYKEKSDRVNSELVKRRGENTAALNDKVAELQAKLDAMLVQYTEGHPEIIKLRTDIDFARQQMKKKQTSAPDSHARKTVRHQDKKLDGPSGATASESDGGQRDRNDAAAKQFSSDRGDSVRVEDLSTSELERQRDAYKIIYDDLTRKMGKAEVSAQVEGQDKATTFRIIDPAVLPTSPSGPGRLKIMLISIFGGVIGGAGLVILLDMLDRTIKDLGTLKGTGLAIIGIIPHIRNEQVVLATRRKDVLLYSVTGLYCIGIASVITLELLGAWK